MDLHKKTSLGHYHLEDKQTVHDLPVYIRNEIFASQPSTFLPPHVVEQTKIADDVILTTRVIPETGTRMDIYFLQGKHCPKQINRLYVCDIIEMYIRVLETIAPKTLNLVQIVILPTMHKKVIDMDFKQPFSPNSINSGVTIWKASVSFIIVYRLEEMYKVLLHELCHMYGFDYQKNDTTYDKTISIEHHIKSNILRLSESFNESLTVCLYLGFFIFVKRPEHTINIKSFLTEYKGCYRLVQLYCAKVAAKLKLYSNRHFNGVWNEHTSAFAYYVGKSALLLNTMHLFSFLNKIKKYIDNNPQKITQFLILLHESLNNKVFHKLIKHYMTEIQQIDQSDMFIRTLRMCNFDIAEKID